MSAHPDRVLVKIIESPATILLRTPCKASPTPSPATPSPPPAERFAGRVDPAHQQPEDNQQGFHESQEQRRRGRSGDPVCSASARRAGPPTLATKRAATMTRIAP